MAAQQCVVDSTSLSRSGQSVFLGSNFMWWKYRAVISSMMDIVPPPCPICVEPKISKQLLRTTLAFFSRSLINFSSCDIFLPPFRLNIDRFQRQFGAAAGTGIIVIPQHRFLRGYRPHVESALDFLAEVEQHVAFAAVDFFRHSYLSFLSDFLHFII